MIDHTNRCVNPPLGMPMRAESVMSEAENVMEERGKVYCNVPVMVLGQTGAQGSRTRPQGRRKKV